MFNDESAASDLTPGTKRHVPVQIQSGVVPITGSLNPLFSEDMSAEGAAGYYEGSRASEGLVPADIFLVGYSQAPGKYSVQQESLQIIPGALDDLRGAKGSWLGLLRSFFPLGLNRNVSSKGKMEMNPAATATMNVTGLGRLTTWTRAVHPGQAVAVYPLLVSEAGPSTKDGLYRPVHVHAIAASDLFLLVLAALATEDNGGAAPDAGYFRGLGAAQWNALLQEARDLTRKWTVGTAYTYGKDTMVILVNVTPNGF